MIQNMMIIVLLICFIYVGVYSYIIQCNHFFQSSKVVIFLRKFGLATETRTRMPFGVGFWIQCINQFCYGEIFWEGLISSHPLSRKENLPMQSLCRFPTDYIHIISHLTVFVKRIYEKILKIFFWGNVIAQAMDIFLIFLIYCAPYS